MATVKEINHDSSMVIGDFYSSVTDPDGAVTVTAGAALDGSTYGVDMDYDAGVNDVFLSETFTATGSQFRWRFRVNLANITSSGSGNVWFGCDVENAASFGIVRCTFDTTGAGLFNMDCQYWKDGTGWTVVQNNISIAASGDTCVEVRVIRETADTNADGEIEVYVNGVSQGSISNAENFIRYSTGGAEIRVYFQTSIGAISGNLYYDEFIIDDSNTADLGCGPAPTLSLAPMTKPADVDAAGAYIYVALLQGGTPILTKISTALNADGTTVFDPGAGDNIGVECGRFNSDVVWVAGQFNATNVVEKSEDGGTSFSVADSGAIGGIRSFVMGPDSDDRLLVFDEDNGDLLETIDGGTNWTTINATVTPEVNAIGRFGKNVQESVFGNQGAANNNVDYSVNSGADLEDFVLPVNQDVTGVIVN